jgi:hypothetical protein
VRLPLVECKGVGLGGGTSLPTRDGLESWREGGAPRLGNFGSADIDRCCSDAPPPRAQAISRLRVMQLGASPLPPPDAVAAADLELEREAALMREAELWENDDECSFFGTLFDPGTGERRRMACNPRTAELLGMHREELLTRCVWICYLSARCWGGLSARCSSHSVLDLWGKN